MSTTTHLMTADELFNLPDWLVEPRQRTIEVVRSDGLRKLFHESDELVDETVPGFRVPVSEIFN